MKHAISTLSGGLLDAAVALAEGWTLHKAPPEWRELGVLYTLENPSTRREEFVAEHSDTHRMGAWFRHYLLYSPTRDGSCCMGLMMSRKIGVTWLFNASGLVATWRSSWGAKGFSHHDDPRVCVCRAVVASSFGGDEVELP